MRGNNPPPSLEIEVKNALYGPLAPKTAREWLLVLAPPVGWHDEETRRKLQFSGSRYSASLLPSEDTPTASTIDLNGLRFGKRKILAVREQGICCCGSCIANIDFLESRNDKLVRATDEIWPRFPWVTKNGNATDRIAFVLSRGGKSVRIDGLHPHTQKNVTIYRLRWSPKRKRFSVTFRHKDWPRRSARAAKLVISRTKNEAGALSLDVK